MSLSRQEVEKIAHLARIGLSEEELVHFQSQLEKVLGYIDQLKQLDVSSVEPTAHVLDLRNVDRPDIVRPSLDVEDVLKVAPARKGYFFKVPRVIHET